MELSDKNSNILNFWILYKKILFFQYNLIERIYNYLILIYLYG